MPFVIERPTHFNISNTAAFPLRSKGESPHSKQAHVVVDLAQRRKNTEQTGENFLSTNWLKAEIERESSKPLTADKTPWYHLAGTGFFVKEQVSQLMKNAKDTMGKVAPDVLDLELAKVKVDIESFEDEYLKQMLNLRFNLGWANVKGKERIVCPDYNNKLWEAVTDKKEREGAVYDALFDEHKGLEKRLRTAPAGTLSVAVSPAGWSNLRDADGNAITYPESQVYVIKKDKTGSLQAYTFRYEANISQNIALQKLLGQPEIASRDQKAAIKNVMKNVAMITPQDADAAEKQGKKAVHDFSDVVDVMQAAVGNKDIAYEGQSFDGIRSFLQNPVFERHPLTEPLIRRLQDYVRFEYAQEHSETERERNIQIATAVTVLQLNKVYRQEEKAEEAQETYRGARLLGNTRQDKRIIMPEYLRKMNYGNEREDLQERPGCAGGGKKKVRITSMGVSRNAETTEAFNCPKCGYVAHGPVGDTCPSCHITKSEFAKLTGAATCA